MAIYVAVVAVLSIAFGLLLDLVIASTGIKPVIAMGTAGGLPAPVSLVATAVFVVLLVGSVARAPVPPELARIGTWLERVSGFAVTRRGLARLSVAVGMVGWLSTTLLVVGPGERGAILRFGQLVIGDRIEVQEIQALPFEAEAERLDRQPGVVLDAGEPLLRGGGHQPPVAQQAARGLVVKSRHAEDVHGLRHSMTATKGPAWKRCTSCSTTSFTWTST